MNNESCIYLLVRWSGLLPSRREGSHYPSIMSYSIHEPERLQQSATKDPSYIYNYVRESPKPTNTAKKFSPLITEAPDVLAGRPGARRRKVPSLAASQIFISTQRREVWNFTSELSLLV